MIKRIDKLILSSFWAPYLLSFLVAEFVLVIQFMWKYIDDILGKGFPILSMIKLIVYFAITITPQAIPLTILISSIMVFGNLSEKFELSSMKSAGISLLRIMRPAIIIAIATAGFSFISSNFLKPKASYKFYSLFISMRKQKPSLSIEEGIFCKDFKDYVIRVGEKDKNDRDIKEVIIYDHTSIDRSLVNVIKAKSGEMYSSNNNEFIMELRDGYQYQEMKSAPGKRKENQDPLMRVNFESFTKVFDMSEFEMDENSLITTRNKYDMLSQNQLGDAIDSIDRQILVKTSEIRYEYSDMLDLYQDEDKSEKLDERLEEENDKEIEEKKIQPNKGLESIEKNVSLAKLKATLTNKSKITNTKNVNRKRRQLSDGYELALVDTDGYDKYNSFYDLIVPSRQLEVLQSTYKEVNSFKSKYSNNRALVTNMKNLRKRYVIRKNQQISWALVCILFLFIGAPLGSIIRKGGYGYPLLVAIIFYVTFIITGIMGEKLIKRNDFSPILAAWLPVIILTPFAISFTILALRDIKLDLISKIQGLFQRG